MIFFPKQLALSGDFLLVTAFWGDGHHWYLVSKGQGCFFYLFVYLLILFLAVGMVVPGLFSAVCGLSLVVEHGASLLL